MNSIKKIALFFLTLTLINCGDEINNLTENISSVPVPSDNYQTITNNTTNTLSFDEVDKTLKKGDVLKLRVNRSKFSVEEYDVIFDGTYNDDGEKLIFCRTNNLVVGRGDSGSPLLTQDGKIIGSLCYGFSFANHQFAARAIEDVISIESNNIISNTTSTSFSKLNLVYNVNGMNKANLESYISKDSKDILKNYSSSFTNLNSNPGKFLSTNNISSIIAGQSIAVSEIIGSKVNISATGTISYIDDQYIFAFGHSYSGDLSTLGLPVYLAQMTTLIESKEIGFKISTPTTQYLGSMVSDVHEGIKIERNTTPLMYDLNTSITINSDTYNDVHKIAHNNNNYYKQEYHALGLPEYLLNGYFTQNELQNYTVSGTIDITYKDNNILINLDDYLTSSSSSIAEYIYLKMANAFNDITLKSDILKLDYQVIITE